MTRHTHAPYRCTGKTVVRLDCAQGTTEVRLNVRTSSSPIGIKPPISATRQERTPFLSHSLSRSFFFLPSKGRRTDLHSPLTWASEGPHRANLPPFPTRPMCRTINPRAERDKRKDKPTDNWELTTERWIQPRLEIQISIDVGELAYSAENRSGRHLCSIPKPSFPNWRKRWRTNARMFLDRRCNRKYLNQGRPKKSTPTMEHHTPPVEATIENPNASVSQPTSRSRNVMHTPPEPDVVSSDSTNSVREQLRQVNQRLDEVQRDFVRSKEEVGETIKGRSPFVPKIQDKPVPSGFRLSTFEPYDGSTDLSEHVAMFRAQMALYDTSDALMCRAFPTTLREPARMWYSRLKPSSISSFDHFTKEFELNFMTNSRPRPIVASLLGLTQGSDEPLAQFVGRFAAEVRRMPDTHPSLAIQAFLMGLRPSRFFWSLIERPPSIVPEMLQRANQYVATETLVAEKREDHKKSRGDKPQGQPSGTSRRMDRPELPAPRPLPIPLNSIQTEVFLQIRDKGLLRTPNPIRTKIGGQDKRRYYRFHQDYRHDMEEFNDLKNQIEDFIRQGHLKQFV
ncbi:hypothetical protein B296_00027580 [Ensete ventricosum]|uniref:Retrotransposon gag domain-containing protein n=1 Tax=Ensete ventricosum TaxID=4639 RepID=A0A426YZB5_ENSVE|nr:hypothetical protein B296_00027580 [Ensete ventricosum]